MNPFEWGIPLMFVVAMVCLFLGYAFEYGWIN